MIRNDAEYAVALKRIAEGRDRLQDQRAMYETEGYSDIEVERLLAGVSIFQLQQEAEAETYLRWKVGDFSGLGLESIALLPIAGRIARGLSQRELAELLGGKHESAVSRDERNEYHGITVDRLQEILKVLGVIQGADGVFRLDFRQGSPAGVPGLRCEFVSPAKHAAVEFDEPPHHTPSDRRLAA